ncbi:hypothetical protein V3W47_08725 [Deinococcus sp. YIM 134068]|uniref:hypothetical protein n=1 Tax=Deinococcus lichenicola TaxID=3118910 RepID=UPI002F940885
MTAQDNLRVPNRPPLMINPAKGRVMALPSWAQSFMDAGNLVATQPVKPPITLAVSLPTRTLAAVFAALGTVHARRQLSTSAVNQFEEIWVMTGEVQVRYRQKDQAKATIAPVIGRRELNGHRYLVIQTRRNGTTQVPEQLLQELVIQRAGTPKRAKALAFNDPWLAQMLEGCEAEQYLFHDRHDCLIVGQDSLLRREAALELQLPGATPGAPRLSGTVDCVLRVRRWQAEGRVFSSDVLPANTDPNDADAAHLQHLQAFPVVIFDGAGAYLRWRHPLRRQHHLVLLSRTDRRFDEAVSVVDQAFKMRAGHHLTFPVPPGIEGLAFRRSR